MAYLALSHMLTHAIAITIATPKCNTGNFHFRIGYDLDRQT